MRGDRITLTGVRAHGFHGVLARERAEGQPFVVDVVLQVDLRAAERSDDLTRTVSYAEVAADVVAEIEGEAHDLIETLAGRIAARCLARALVEAVDVTVHKPQAPVGAAVGDVAVSVHRERSVPVVIALGANLGDPVDALHRAGGALRRSRGLREVRLSPVYRTAPVGGPPQPDYANAVALARCRWAPERLLAELQRLEAAAGRTREERWGPRRLDLDLVSYGTPGEPDEVVVDTEELTLPHPRVHDRAFVLVPWLQLDPLARIRRGQDVVAVRDLVTGAADEEIHLWEEGS